MPLASRTDSAKRTGSDDLHDTARTSDVASGATIIVAGCLGMIYSQLTLCPAGIEFVRHLGGSGVHVGILGAIPTGMLFLQFFAAVVANHLTYRRWLWMAVSIVQRLILLPVAIGPMLLPEVSDKTWLWLFLSLSMINHGLLHFATPLWMSWMGDYLPRRGLSQFWGIRHRWMQWAGAASLFFASVLLKYYASDIRSAFAVLISIAAVVGVIDILMFVWVDEPKVTKSTDTRFRKVLAEPFRNRDFRSFITFMSVWHFAAMVGSPFIGLFLLSEVGMSLSRLLLLWVFCWVGGALCSARIGNMVEHFGHRPMLILCTALKSSNMIALVFVPNEPSFALKLLLPVFVLDSILNAGFVVASNGFMLTKSPAGNRTMYIAAGTALAGMVGGLTSIGTGVLLTFANLHTVVLGHELTSYRLMFSVSALLRLGTVLLVIRIREPDAHGVGRVMSQLIGASPLRLIRFPVGFFLSSAENNQRNDKDAN